jgi:DNA replication and repair protein RecF
MSQAKLDPLRFEQLFARGFRNLAPLDVVPGARFNVVSGDNAQGKSSFLEALAYLGSLRSFRGAKAEDLIRRDEESATLACRVSGPPAPHTLKVRLWRGRARELALDDKRPRSTAAWLGVCPVVLFHPGDLELAQGGPEGRRALLDGMLEEIDPTYGSTLAEYVKALRSRNRLLKREGVVDVRAITAYDPLLANAGAVLMRARREIVAEIAPLTATTFASIFGGEAPVTVRYAPRVEGDSEDAIRDALARSLEKDRARKFTAEGPHADDVSLEVHARGARHHASQGQQRTIVLALKVAELEVIARRIGRVPPLLLDDVSSELDRTRNRRFFELLARLGGQVFLTTTHPELILLDESGDARADWRVEAGRIERAAR